MRIGELRHRVTIQQKSLTQDAEGVVTESWVDVATVWAAVENLHGREYWEAAAVQSENTVKFTIRYRPDINQTMRIVFRDQAYEITVIDNIKYRNEYLEIKAVKRDVNS